MERRPVLGLTLLLFIALSACGGDQAEDTSRRSVVAAFYPLEFIAVNVAGSEADVTGITPAGVQPHNLALTSAQVQSINEADLLVYLGSFQPALDELAAEVERKLDVLALESSALRPGDPHVWLDPAFMVRIANEVARQLAEADPSNAEFYETNAESLVSRLNEIDDRFSNGLARCERRQIVTSHDGFGYLADRFNLERIAIAGIDPGQPVSAGRIDEIARVVREAGLTTIFVEPLLAPGSAESLAEATGTETATLDPLESPPVTGDYISVMQDNLSALRRALGCR